MAIDKIRKTSVKGVKFKSESYFSISLGVLELGLKGLCQENLKKIFRKWGIYVQNRNNSSNIIQSSTNVDQNRYLSKLYGGKIFFILETY